MYPLFESVCVKNGQILNLEWHSARYDFSIRQLYRQPPKFPLFARIPLPKTGLYKLRISYNLEHCAWEFSAYNPPPIRTLKLIASPDLDYALKYTNRQALHALYACRGPCDDILIVQRGLITDSSRHNILLYDGDLWYTPEPPLLAGTARSRLIAAGQIIPIAISQAQLFARYSEFKLINCMQDFQDAPRMQVSQGIMI